MFDIILVGGGLQGALLTLALQAHQPRARIAVVDQDTRLGGNHTWCFHAGDVSSACREWIDPLVSVRWAGTQVRFPGYQKRMPREYAAIRSDRLHEVLMQRLTHPHEVRLDSPATNLEARQVTLASGERLQAHLVVDARGPRLDLAGAASAGYQKFVGIEFECTTPHGWTEPLLMDATVEQFDGFRFVYVLPFSETRLLIEETFFSNGAELHPEEARRRIWSYLENAGVQQAQELREERGVLPMPWRDSSTAPTQGPFEAGYRGGFFHPATGYSLPVAARLADFVARRPLRELFVGDALQEFCKRHQRQVSFCHLLNAMLFQWFAPENRWHVYRRFYGLPQETIDRFFALQLRPLDQGRLVLGRPPRGFSVRYRLSRGAAS